MKFLELLNMVTWNDVWIELIKKYSDQKDSKNGYLKVFNELKTLQSKESKYRICIEYVLDEIHKKISGKEFWYYDIYGKDGTLQKDTEDFKYCNFENDEDKERFGNQEVTYAIEFISWEEWLGMEIDKSTLHLLTTEQIIAYCLYEMTFCGYEQDEIQSQHTELKNRVDDIKNMTEEDLKKNTVTIEELKEKLNRRLNS